jgi:uncharacterized protein YggE
MQRTWVPLAVVLGLLVMVGAVLSGTASMRLRQAAAQDTVTVQRSISVSGEGRVSLPTDTATLTLGAEVFDPDAAAAQREVQRRMEAILSVFRQAGIPESKVKTVMYSMSVERDWNQPTTVIGYRVTHLVEVQVQPVERTGDLLNRAVQAGANAVTNISLSVSNPAAALRQARELAVRDAREKAAQLAQLSGVALGAPLRIVESTSSTWDATIVVIVSIDYAIQ